jgi:hypothetical protein
MLPSDIKNQHILYCILDWGLGHAFRSIPIIKTLLANNNRLTIASSRHILNICKSEIEVMEILELPTYDVKYFNRIPAWLSIIWQYKKINTCIKEEHLSLNEMFKIKQWDVVISDSRYGCYISSIPNFFISHQLYLKAPIFSNWINKQYQKFLKPFNAIWVPDLETENSLSGSLSHHKSISDEINAKRQFIGFSSRFTSNSKIPKSYDYCFILSGPEPVRSQWEKEIIKQFSKVKISIALIRGTSQPLPVVINSENIQVIDLANTHQLQAYIDQSKALVSRSGYSSILDYYQLAMPKYIIATKGQTEQEYLAEHLNGKHGFIRLQSVSELP